MQMSSPPTVADYMAVDLLTFAPDLEINRAMRSLLEKRFSGAPVVDAGGRLVGVLSKKDCLRAAFNATYHRTWGGKVSEYMTSDVKTIEADMPILRAVEQMLAQPFRRLPVTRDGHLVGQISRYDLLQALLDQWQTGPGASATVGEDRG
jgi:predicted transcriptional regulator